MFHILQTAAILVASVVRAQAKLRCRNQMTTHDQHHMVGTERFIGERTLMDNYQGLLREHLAAYAKQRLGVFDQGLYEGKPYPHILPTSLKYLNVLESARREVQGYLSLHPSLKLHQFFNHLNSSQAFAFNLFYVFFSTGGIAARALSSSLGINEDVVSWEFEHVQDSSEGTNVDVMWRSPNGGLVFLRSETFGECLWKRAKR